MSAHTPTPWTLFKTPRPGRAAAAYYIQGPKGRAVAHVKNSTVTPIHANAAHIVRCVNGHDDLVAGIEQALGCLEDPTGGMHVADMRLAATYLRAALAKARR